MDIYSDETGHLEKIEVGHLGGRLPCMATTAMQRTAAVDLNTGELVGMATRDMPYDPEAGAAAA
jgi:hypothetical protein